MKAKLPKNKKPHGRKAGGLRPEARREAIKAGMRRAKRRRRAKGLLSLIEVAVLHDLPRQFVKRAADLGELRTIKSGRRRYVHAEDAERAFGRRRAA
jgi:hypothetical protein